MAAGQAVTVFARQRAVELKNQIRDLVRDRDHFFDFALLLEIDQRPNVHAADRAMAIVARARLMAVKNRSEPRDKLRQLRGLDGRVLDEGDGLFVALGPEKQAEARFSHSPNRLHLVRL